jgi:hypothetical protein
MKHGRTFTRKRLNGSWSEWTEVAVKSDIAAETERALAAESEILQTISEETERAQTVEALKVDKENGKGLSTEDYTAEEKQKLAELENYIPPDMTLVYRGEYDASAAYMKGDAVMGKYGDVGVSAYSTWVSLTDNNVGHTPPSNDSNSYWKIIGSYGSSGFIGRCRYPEIEVRGTTDAERKEKRALVLTRVTTANNTDIWAKLAILNPHTFAEKYGENGLIHDYTVYEEDGELYDKRGKLAAQSEAATEIPLEYSDLNESVTSVSGYILRLNETHGRIMARITLSASVQYWTALFKITNAEVPHNMTIGNRLGHVTTMSVTSWNGTSIQTICLDYNNNVKCGATLNSGWDYTMVIDY